ncbi:hypothetical protein GGR56DRAFT_132419 [Xylariaceae sp. FL0804]|nr:hypothetical protein GGR56DRAFT_132419 [Xylariaceae sp. FL0804]
MAATTMDNKSGKLEQVTVSTLQVTPTPDSSPNGEKTHDIKMELRRNSAVSTPSSAHASNGFDTDVEAMMPVPSSDPLSKATTAQTKSNPNCTVWPGQAHWKQKSRAAKIKNRSCQPMARLSKRTRILVKIAIALLIVGIAVAIGFGVSKSLGARVYHQSSD